MAYSDEDVPLGNGRFLMEPMVLARLIQILQPRAEERALVVASGRGYGAALLARLVTSVVAIESDPALAAAAAADGPGAGRVGRRAPGRADGGGGTAGRTLRRHPDRGRRARRCRRPCSTSLAMADGSLRSSPAPTEGAGTAQLFVKDAGVASGRPLFDAGTPVLAGICAAAALHVLSVPADAGVAQD